MRRGKGFGGQQGRERVSYSTSIPTGILSVSFTNEPEIPNTCRRLTRNTQQTHHLSPWQQKRKRTEATTTIPLEKKKSHLHHSSNVKRFPRFLAIP